jgi:2-polyprenyl-6-methoxyphenol hydroxylase-like FAD-dependent oxidoreductase
MPSRCDVAVVGGGPAGSTAAAFLARAGLDVICLERERFPRFHVGESLLPASLPLFDRLGVREQIESAGFQRKNGAVFADETEHRGVTLNFRRGPAWEDHAYNVPRADFDRILLDHATKEGAVVREGVEVRDVGLRDDGVRLTVEVAGGATEEVEAAFLVDASGRDALIASRLGRRVPLPDLGKAALFAHYRGARRASRRLEGHLQAYLFDVFFAPRPPATLKDALTTVFAGGGVPRATTLASRSARGRAPGRPARPLAPAAARPASGIAAVVVTGRVTAPRSPSRRSRSSRQRA